MWLEVRDPSEYFLVPIDIKKTVGQKFNSSCSTSTWVDRIPRMHALSYTYYIVNPKQFSWSQIISITLCDESKYSTMMYHGYAPMLGMCAIPTKALAPPSHHCDCHDGIAFTLWRHKPSSVSPQRKTLWDPVDPTTYTYREGSSHQYVLAVLAIRTVLDVRFLQAPEKPSTKIWSWVMVMFFQNQTRSHTTLWYIGSVVKSSATF